MKVDFVNANHATVVGQQEAIYYTTNGGESWSQKPNTLISTGGYSGVSFSDANNGTIVYWGGTLRTTDGGLNWYQQLHTSSGYYLNDVYFVNKNIGWIVGGHGNILKTTDGGNNWFLQFHIDNVYLTSLSFVNSSYGTAVGYKSTIKQDSAVGIIVRTTNGGNTWEEQPNNSTAQLNSVSFSDINNGIIVGNNGTVLITTNGGYTSVRNNYFKLEQNYPNPFNPTTTIKYTVPKESFVTIKVYDVLGKEIKTLVNEDKPAGSYEVEFNGSKYPSGIYFYRIQAGGYTSVKKMILLK